MTTTETNQKKSEQSSTRQTDHKNRPNHKQPHKKVDNRLRMLVDASKTEETRVAIVRSGRLEDFEVESLVRRQIKGNIYLAKVTRVEPSLQAAFVNYGGNRHGFLPFSEIHPDYYRIPVADRERLMAEQAELERKAAEEAARIAEEEDRQAAELGESDVSPASSEQDENIIEINDEDNIMEAGIDAEQIEEDDDEDDDDESEEDEDGDDQEDENNNQLNAPVSKNSDSVTDADGNTTESAEGVNTDAGHGDESDEDRRGRRRGRGRFRRRGRGGGRQYAESRNTPDRVSDDADDELNIEPFWKRIRRAYKIQEVIKRGQILLIQVTKEERGNKGAAVTTYITLPGRYCVLMPNTPQSGGVSRKISDFKDRKRMRDILKDLSVPDGMSVILRTAGTSRTKVEIKRDLDYLMRLWNSARDLTLQSTAPALINEEGSLIKRAIRDIYHKDIEEIVVSGDEGYKSARDMMKMLMPSHSKKVLEYKETTPLFIAEKLEKQIEDMHSPQVELKSGGYLVINPTEALVSIDVNSGRATKERNIDDTALRTNLEAAEEIARQLRLRDLGGLVVIDFIDMENRRFNGKVEKAMRDALAGDRARIQIGRISSFGLMEMSRQRLHPSLTETHFESCPHCHGMGIVKTVETMALTILRAIEELALQQPNSIVTTTMAHEVALYLFNYHRRAITDLETRYNLTIAVSVGAVEDHCGYALNAQVKQKDFDDDDNAGEDMSDDNSAMAERTDRHDQKSQDSDYKKSGRNRSRRGGRNRQKSDQVKTDESAPEGRVSDGNASDHKKIAIKEVGSEAQKPSYDQRPQHAEKAESSAQAGASPTNDNRGKVAAAEKPSSPAPAASTPAAKDSETVNAAPKTKKKGWWNKITS